MGSAEGIKERDDTSSGKVKCRPFLKWAGGKWSILPELLARLPKKWKTYFEPFVGGGALFFELRPSKAVLSDVNADLINAYKTVRDKIEDLVVDLGRHKHSSKYFYKVRDADRKGDFWLWSDVEKASRLIYLNKTCFNGLYRVNSRGEFNVPFGDYKNPKILDEENLRACSRALKEVTLEVSTFDAVADRAKRGDFVYFDPPFAPLTKTANFTSYSKSGFSLTDHERLRDVCRALEKKGVWFMLSNSHTEAVLEIFGEFNIDVISAPRAISAKGVSRGKVQEVVVRNY